MLVNFSNHPTSEWSREQLETAREQFGTIKDVKHPDILPDWDAKKIREIAAKYHEQIMSWTPRAVHIMGEHTFCFTLVSLLQTSGVRCIASTTIRSVNKVNDHEIRRSFTFVRFRGYPLIKDLPAPGDTNSI